MKFSINWKNLLLVLISLTFVFMVSEIVLRSIDPPFFKSEQYEFDPLLGWTNRPGHFFYYGAGDREPYLISFNNEGFRDLNYPVQKPAGTLRIAVIGDSFSETVSVSLEDTYWKVLERRMGEIMPNRVEVMNFGVGDYGTAQEYIALRNHALRYKPDALMVQVFPFNDILNNSISALYLNSPHDMYRPFLVPRGEDFELVYPQSLLAKLRRYSYAFRYGEIPFRTAVGAILRRSPPGSEEFWKATYRDTLNKYSLPMDYQFIPILMNIFSRPDDQFPFIRDGWAATESTLKLIHETAKDADIPMAVIVFPAEWQLREEPEEWMRKLPFPTDRRYADNRIRELFEQSDVPVISFLDVFGNNLDEVLPFILGHYNSSGNRLIGEALAPVMTGLLLVTYKLGEELKFGDGGSGPKYFTRGLATTSNDFCWTADTVVRMEIMLPQVRKDLTLNINASPFAPEQLGDNQFVDVYFNGTHIKRWMLKGADAQLYQATIDQALINASEASVIELRFSERKSSLELGIAPDYRLLGLGIITMAIQ